MLGAIRKRLTYANVMATIAVFFSLAGGAYAVSIPRNSVGKTQLKKNAVNSDKVANGSLQPVDFKAGVLSPTKITSPNGQYSVEARDTGLVLRGPDGTLMSLDATIVSVSSQIIRMGAFGTACKNPVSMWTSPTAVASSKYVSVC